MIQMLTEWVPGLGLCGRRWILVVAAIALLFLYQLVFSTPAVDSRRPQPQTTYEVLSNDININPGEYGSRRLPTPDTPSTPAVCEPSLDFEVTRRLVETNLRDTWFFFSNRMKEIKSWSNETKTKEDLNYLMKEGAERIRVLQYDLGRLSQLDGAGSWRKREARELSDKVQRRLHRLQNPPDCATAKKLVCSINHSCGLGCELHHLICCFMAAYGSHRTIIINTPGWSYTQKGWEDVFLPLSETCTTFSRENVTQWPGKPDSQTVLFIGVDTRPKPDHFPLAIPRDISERLIRLHGNPSAWWVGQFIKYVFKLQPSMQEIINRSEKSINFQHPVVGVHVRRTDKKREASYYKLEEYMEQVEEYYDGLQIFDTNVTRRIYLASEEPAIFTEAREKYPHYEILYHQKSVDVVNDANRFSLASLRDFIVDVHFLSRSDYIVVSFSSNVGRLIYGLMQSLSSDASKRIFSVDNPYYYHNQRPDFYRARFLHESDRDNMTIHPGEKLVFLPWERHFSKDSYLPYTNSEKKMTKMPYYKLEYIVDVVNMSYPYLD